MRPVRLLHITDLHFSEVGQPQAGDFKVDNPDIRSALPGDEAEGFLSRLKRKLADWPGGETEWPKLIVVTGDLVERGDNPAEFEIAVSFLKDLASMMRIGHDRIFVVPGNHDVDWSPGLTIRQRFENFYGAMQKARFTTTPVAEAGPIAQLIQLPTIEGVDIEILLLVSPTFSGIPHPNVDMVFNRLRELLSDLPAADLQRIRGALTQAEGSVDIAAIGDGQLQAVQRSTGRSSVLRIAALHHHLLPDPQIEVSLFESVLDAGRVIEHLLEADFDLVLSGHKHNRRLVHYSRPDDAAQPPRQRKIDIYNGPSLFKQGRAEPAFTIIDLFGPTNPTYAKLECFSTSGIIPSARYELMREGRVSPQVVSACTALPLEEQLSRLLPLVESTRQIRAWTSGIAGGPAKAAVAGLVESAWLTVRDELANIGRKQLVFRGANLHRRWADLLEIAQSRPSPKLRLASASDIAFWQNAREQPNSEAALYENEVRDFAGEKARILLLNWYELRDNNKQIAAEEIIEWMISAGIEVSVHWAYRMPFGENDFGVISDIAVSTFQSMWGGSVARDLVERFEPDVVSEYDKRWETLREMPDGWNPRVGNFRKWLNETPPVV